MKLRVVFEPSDTAAKNMIWDERRLIVWDLFHFPLQFYKFMIRSGLFERVYKSRKMWAVRCTERAEVPL